jgi:uncharacterized glyoxalase superfamily protein PhnB
MKAALLATVAAIAAITSPTWAQENSQMTPTQQNPAMTHVKKMTPNLYTDDVAACVRFWVERLHFEKTMEVKEGDGLAFAALQKGPIELMYGSYTSLQADPKTASAFRRGTSFLFIEVDDVESVLRALQGAPLVSPLHKTFYGSTEFTVTDPAGHLLTFAQFPKQ